MHLKEAWTLYLDNFLSILFIAVMIVFPVQLVALTFSSLSFSMLCSTRISVVVSMTNQIFLLNLMQIPFVDLASRVITVQKVNLRGIFGNFIMLLVPVCILNFYFILCILAGAVLLIIPGIFMLILMFIFPYVAVNDKKIGMDLFKQMYWIGRSGCVDMAIILFIFICFNTLIWALTTNGVAWLNMTSFGALIALRLTLNSLLFPLFVFVVSLNYQDWKEETKKLWNKFLIQSNVAEVKPMDFEPPIEKKHTSENLPPFKKTSSVFTVFLSFITFGIYIPYWFLSRRKSLNLLESKEHMTLTPPLTMLVLYSVVAITFIPMVIFASG